MELNKSDITGIILAGGKSLRMKVDKGLMDWKGSSMITYAIKLLTPFCDRIIISTSNPAYQVFGLELVPDIYPNCGPMGGLISCLNQSTTQANICLSCDLPNMQPEVIEFLVKSFDGTSCVVPMNNYPEPLCSIYPATSKLSIIKLIESKKYSMLEIFNTFPVKFIKAKEFPFFLDPQYFANVNSPADIIKSLKD